MRQPRFIVPAQPIEITVRTVDERFLLPMTHHFHRIVVGVLARGQELYPLDIHSYVMLSNHFHLILTPPDANQLARFMGFVNQNISREASRLNGWRGPLWGRRFTAIPISPEEGILEERLRYHLAHGVKEGLVEKARDWEGPHCGRALSTGAAPKGTWYNRSIQSRRPNARPAEYLEHYTLKLTPLPCWSHLSSAARVRRVRAMIREIENGAAAQRARTGRSVVGMKVVQKQDPLSRPGQTKRSPKPLVHAASRAARERFRAAFHAFLAVYRQAAVQLKQGSTESRFPGGCFPPACPFVRRSFEFQPF